jgi:RNA polymerase sigma-70 factor (ECF subfamily)
VVYDAILELDEREQTIVALRFFAGCSYEEIADVVGISSGAARTALSRALALVREKLSSTPGNRAT